MGMKSISIELSEDQYRALEQLAKENGFEPEVLVRNQIKGLIETYFGDGLTPGMKEHLKASIQENSHLLERLAR